MEDSEKYEAALVLQKTLQSKWLEIVKTTEVYKKTIIKLGNDSVEFAHYLTHQEYLDNMVLLNECYKNKEEIRQLETKMKK